MKNLQEKEAKISQHLPFAYIDEEDFICTVHGDYMAVLKIEGISWNNLEDADLNLQHTLRSQLLNHIADPKFAVYHTIIRSRANILADSRIDNHTARQIHQEYQGRLENNPPFINDLYLTIILKGTRNKSNRFVTRFKQWYSQVSHQINQNQAEETRQAAIKNLKTIVLRITAALEQYQIRQLRQYQTSQGIFSEPLQFFARILNWQDQPILAIEENISQYIAKNHLFIGAKSIESVGNADDSSHFSALLSLKEYPQQTYPGMLDYLLQLPIEMVVTQSFAFQHRQQTRENLELQLRRLRQSRDPDQNGAQQLQQALGAVVANEFSFGYHHLTVMVIAKQLSDLEQNIAAVDKRLGECGVVAVRERLNLEAAFWAQFPGNLRYIVRKSPITTDNFASFASFNNEPKGNRIDNHWGEAITVLKTVANSPYYFNFHPRGSDVGHTLILGITGSGKTLLTCFLISAALKHKSRVFYFDKDHGAEAFMRSLGADYSVLGNGLSCGLNPLQLPSTPKNRRFLVEWLSSLLTAFGEPLTSEEIEIVHHAVQLNYEKLSPEQRTLKNLADAFGPAGPGTLRQRIDQWHSDKALSEFFSATEDTLQLDNPCYCFEMGQLLQRGNAIALPSVLLYLFHRIELALEENTTNTPAIICLDEAWALFNNPIFSEGIRNWLKTFRKRNAIVVMLSQEVNDVTDAKICATINAETATKIFFPDPAPNQDIYQNIFQLSPREILLLKEYSQRQDQRYFLIKQPNESGFATLDLMGMEQWLSVLSGNRFTLGILRQLIEKYGQKPESWLSHYLEETKHGKV